MADVRRLSAGIVDVSFGRDVTVIEPCNLYGCNVEDEVFIGPFVEIQKSVTVGRGSRIQSHSFVCEFTSIGEDCFIGHGVMFINDRFSRGGLRVAIRAYGNQHGLETGSRSAATLRYCQYICDRAVIGAGAVVTKDITEAAIYAGNPARKIKDLP